MEFQILGPFQALDEGLPIPLGGPKQRLVLALLLIEANRTVPVDRLIDRIWGDEPPEAARSTIQAYVSRLRKALPPKRIEAHPPGYLLHAAPEEVDALRFERAVGDAHSRLSSDPQAAKSQLDAALRLWRGPVLADLDPLPAVRSEITRLEELRLAAFEDLADAQLALGQNAELIPELERLLAESPLRERLWAALMLGLYRAGRQADALGAYHRARRLLRDELGIDPSTELQRLQERILKQDPDLDLHGRRLRGYELIERVGDGAFGIVYRAYQPGVGRDVAVKAIHRRLANQSEFVRRFELEARLVARLEHPHIVPLYDYWREPDGAYLAMRYLRGGSLKEIIETRGPMSGDAASSVVEQVASALGAAHRQGVIHRDVRPANILFDEDGNAYLSDFGIAKELATAGALNRRIGGLVYYLAPEEIRDEEISPATDVYSLGLVVYEMLAGEHPFRESPPSEVLARQLNSPIPPIDEVRPDLPPAVAAVIETATAKDPRGRYADAANLAAAFRSAIEGGPAPTRSVALRNPYKGLRPFDEVDAPDFFGREQLAARLVVRLAEPAPTSRFLALVGPSGSGKSSVVRAGLVPALRKGALPGSDRWFIVTMHPGTQPFAELEGALLKIALSRPASLLEDLERGEHGLLDAAQRLLPRDEGELLVVIDQFEELFTLVADERVRSLFLDSLVTAASAPASRVRLVVTLRADLFDRPLLHERFAALLADRVEAVTPMGPRELEAAIVRPAERVGMTMDPGLVSEIRSDVVAQPGSLPLLQYALTELFEEAPGSTLTAAAYSAVGGVAGALGRRAEALYSRLDEAAREATRQLLLRLVSIGEDGSQDARRRALRSELTSIGTDASAMEQVIDLFGSHRLLSFDRDSATREPTAELAHEALLIHWDRLRDWIESAREDLRFHRRFAAEASQWRESGREQSFLLRGIRLEQAGAWSGGTSISLTTQEREYLDESRRQRAGEEAVETARQQAEERLRRRALTRLRALVAVLVAGVLAAGSLGIAAIDRSRQAMREARIATARELASAARAELDRDAERSLLLALEAVETTRRADGSVLPEAEEVLHAALQAHRLVMTLPGQLGVYSWDGSRLLVIGSDVATFEVHDAATGELVVRQGVGNPGDPVYEGRIEGFAPDGSVFVASAPSSGRYTAAYDTRTGERLWRKPFCCNDVQVTPDGRYFSVYGNTETIHLRDLMTGELVNTFPAGVLVQAPDSQRGFLFGDFGNDREGHVVGYIGELHEPRGGTDYLTVRGDLQNVVDGAWSRDGTRLAAAGTSTVIVWDATTARQELEFNVSGGRITTVTFSRDATRIATGLEDGTTLVWDLSADEAVASLHLAGHDGAVRSVAFNGDGTRLLTSGSDGTLKVWDITPKHVPELLTVAGSGAIAYSTDGRLLATGTEAGDVVVYDAATGKVVQTLRGHTGQVRSVDFAAGGLVAAVSGDTVRIWELTGEERLRIEIPGEVIQDVSFSPDGRTVAAVAQTPEPTDGGGTRLYSVATGDLIAQMSRGDETSYFPSLSSVDFSPDGSLLAGAAWSGVYIWSAADGAITMQLSQWEVMALAFTPDGRRLVTVGSDQASSVSRWDVTTGDRLASIPGTMGVVMDVAFIPDGETIVTGASDGTVRLWDAASLRPIFRLANGATGQLAVSPDGSRLAFTSDNDVVHVLSLRVADLVALAQARLTRSWMSAECDRYLHHPCPVETEAPQ